MDPFQVRARRMPVTVGIQQAVPFRDDAPAKSKFFLDEEGCFYSSAGFNRLVYKGQQVGCMHAGEWWPCDLPVGA